MNPSGSEASANQLPPPISEGGTAGGASSEAAQPQPAEQAPAAPEKTAAAPATSSASPPVMPALNLPLPPALASAAPRDDSATAAVSSQSQVPEDDGDLIEKEWVNKAKQIVEKTRDDPYKQSEELTVFKADYMQKRYGKTIKLNQ